MPKFRPWDENKQFYPERDHELANATDRYTTKMADYESYRD